MAAESSTVLLVDGRSAAYGNLVQTFVDKYIDLSPHAEGFKKVMTKLKTDLNINLLKYDSAEGAKLVALIGTNYTEEQLTNLGGRGGPALLQMYDFISTMDSFDKKLTLLDKQVGEIPTVVGTFSDLQTQLPPSDLRPWAFHNTFPSRMQMDEHDIDMTIGQQLFEPIIYDPNGDILASETALLPLFSRERIREKTANERAQDEAHLLHYEAIGTYFAIGQGLFRVKHTPAHTVDFAQIVTHMESRGSMSEKEWPATLKLDGAKTAYISSELIAKGNWINSVINTERILCDVSEIDVGRPYDNLLIIMPKDVDLKRYTDNRFHREYTKRRFISQQDDALLYSPYANVVTVHNLGGTPMAGLGPTTNDLKAGGPIGMYKICWPTTSFEKKANTVLQISDGDVIRAMAAMTWHPIHASAHLAVAYRDHGLFKHFTQRIFALIMKNTDKKKETPLDSSAMDPTKFATNMSIAGVLKQQAKRRARVKPGKIPDFMTLMGEYISPLEAYEMTPVIRELVLRDIVRRESAEGIFHAATIPRPMVKSATKYAPVEYISRSGHPARMFVQNDTAPALLLHHFAAQKAKSAASRTPM